MKASRSVMGQCCHPLSSHSVICLAPSPLQEHFPSACKMITGWLLDFPLLFSVYSPFLPSSHLLIFSLSPTPLPLSSSPALTYNLNSLRPPSPFPLLHHVAFLPLLFSSLKWMLFPWEWSAESRGGRRHLLESQHWCLNAEAADKTAVNSWY